jgi:hypothetical protein
VGPGGFGAQSVGVVTGRDEEAGGDVVTDAEDLE